MIYSFTLLMSILLHFSGSQIASFTSEDEHAFKSFRSLEGHWVKAFPDNGTMHEIWSFKNDSLLLGRGFFMQGNDSTFSEHIQLELKQGKLAYCVRMNHQNQGTTVRFPLKKFGSNTWEFELLSHDFPQQIVYSKPARDSLHVWIEGTQNGIKVRETFDFIRSK